MLTPKYKKPRHGWVSRRWDKVGWNYSGSSNFMVVLVLAEASVGRAFAGGVSPMAVPVNLEEDGGLVPGHAQEVFLHPSFDGVEADV